nr:hypothetical protein [Paraburkholderia rhizosphaerae]
MPARTRLAASPSHQLTGLRPKPEPLRRQQRRSQQEPHPKRQQPELRPKQPEPHPKRLQPVPVPKQQQPVPTQRCR